MRLTWVTNLAPPYRLPVWAALRRAADLDVALLGRHERGRHWDAGAAAGTARHLRTLQVHRGEAAHYLLLERPAAVLRGSDAVVLGGWDSPAYWQLDRAARRRGLPRVVLTESTLASQAFPSGPVAAARTRFLTGADAVLTVGPASTEAVLAAGVDPARVVTSTDPVDVLAFHRGAAARRRPGTDGGHVFLVAGQLVPRKNVLAVAEAFTRVAGPRDRLLVAGDGPLEAELRRRVAGPGTGDRVELLGHLDQDGLLDAYARAHTLVLGSLVEVWGLVVNEALAAGLHAVVSARAGCAASFAGMRGVEVAEPSVDGLAAAMARSRAAWRGPVAEPEVLAHTPEVLARDALRAVEVARGRREPAWHPSR